MPNVSAAINAHNRSILEESKSQEGGGCNCRVPSDCLVQGKLLSTKLQPHQICLTTKTRCTLGISDPAFKGRFRNHEKSFNIEQYKKDTEVNQGSCGIKWRILKQYPSYNPQSKRCMLCTNEILAAILHYEGINFLSE